MNIQQCIIGYYCNCRYNEDGQCQAPILPEEWEDEWQCHQECRCYSEW